MNIKQLEADLPVPYHHTLEVVDSSKLNTYIQCPRRFFYEYVLGWRPEGAKQDLEFGEAWHQALEVLYIHGNSDNAVQLAQMRFLNHYRKYFEDMSDDIYVPKTPAAALRALEEYAKERYPLDMQDFKIIYTEIGMSCPISDEYSISGRMDGVGQFHDTEKLFFLEHKTTKRAGRQWHDQWELAIQLGTYTNFLYTIFGMDNVRGGLVNGAAFRKDGCEIIRVPVWKNEDKMNNWHATVYYWMSLLHEDFKRLAEAKDSDRVMEAFYMNPNSCTNYFGCPYHDFCTVWSNPLQKCHQVPMEFEEDRWDPFDRPTTAEVRHTPEGPVIIQGELTL